MICKNLQKHLSGRKVKVNVDQITEHINVKHLLNSKQFCHLKNML